MTYRFRKEEAVEEKYNALVSYARRLAEKEDAEDAVHDVLLKMIERKEDWPLAYLKRAVARQVVRLKRKAAYPLDQEIQAPEDIEAATVTRLTIEYVLRHAPRLVHIVIADKRTRADYSYAYNKRKRLRCEI